MRLYISRAVVAAAAVLYAGVAGGAPSNPVDTLAKLSLEWVTIRAETARIETEWASQRELLSSTVTVFEDRARDAEAQRDLLKARTAKDRADLEAQEIENRRLAGELGALENHLVEVRERLTVLRPRLPPKLSQALELPLLSLADPNLPAAERMAHTMTVLNRCVQFNRTITFGEEIVAAPGATSPKLMQTVYWGLSHGYAYDKAARQSWFGAPAADGWQWTACHESESAIRELIETFDEKAEPKYVPVPARAGRVFEAPATR
jgi:hypothetical protein